MSGLGEAFAALKNIALLHERVAVLRENVDILNTNVTGLREYAVSIEMRVARLEGFIEGASFSASAQPKLPKD